MKTETDTISTCIKYTQHHWLDMLYTLTTESKCCASSQGQIYKTRVHKCIGLVYYPSIFCLSDLVAAHTRGHMDCTRGVSTHFLATWILTVRYKLFSHFPKYRKIILCASTYIEYDLKHLAVLLIKLSLVNITWCVFSPRLMESCGHKFGNLWSVFADAVWDIYKYYLEFHNPETKTNILVYYSIDNVIL